MPVSSYPPKTDPLTTKGDLLVHNGADSVRMAVGSNGKVPVADSTAATGIAWSASGPMPKNYLDGFQITVTSATQVSVQNGKCRNSTDTLDITMAANDTADITVAGDRDFTEGASTWYYVWVIADSTGANGTRAFLSASSTAPTYPGGYDIGRRVGAVYNDAGSNFLQGAMRGNARTRLFWYTATIQVLSAANQTAYQTLALTSSVPPTSQLVLINAAIDSPSAAADLRLRRAGDSSDSVGNRWLWTTSGQAASQAGMMALNASQQMEWRNTGVVTVTNVIHVVGYYDDL